MENEHSICPWRAGPILTASIRKLFHNPRRILTPYLSEGMTAMDVGCGMGFFTLPMSGIVGKSGKVIAVDLQPEMLGGLKKNAAKIGAENIMPHQCATDSLRVEEWNGAVDFALISWMLHEVPDQERLIRELCATLSDNGKLLFVEPYMHVSGDAFQNSLNMITKCGFAVADAPKVTMSHTALLRKS